MTTGTGILNDIFVIWLPIVFALLIAVLGFVRGVRREAIVSLSIVLAGLILMVWGSSWATDLSTLVRGLSVADWQVTLGYVVMILVVLAAGYGLASALVPRGRPTAASRLGGFLLGLANGAAIAGWIMRNHYLALRDSGATGSVESMDMLYNTPVSFGLILWSGWFPLVVAGAAAIIAIVGPARRVNTTLEEWAPPTTQTTAPPPTLGVAPASTAGAAAVAPPPASSGMSYGGTAQGSTSVLPETRQVPYGARVADSSPIPDARPDSPPTMPMPGSEGRPLYSGGQETLNLGLTDRPAAPERHVTTLPENTLPSRPAAEAITTPPATVSQGDEPSWLAAPLSSGRSDPSLDRHTRTGDDLVARAEAPTVEQRVLDLEDEATVTCPRCGSAVPANSAFCTQCGNRLKGT